MMDIILQVTHIVAMAIILWSPRFRPIASVLLLAAIWYAFLMPEPSRGPDWYAVRAEYDAATALILALFVPVSRANNIQIKLLVLFVVCHSLAWFELRTGINGLMRGHGKIGWMASTQTLHLLQLMFLWEGIKDGYNRAISRLGDLTYRHHQDRPGLAGSRLRHHQIL